MKGGRSFCVVSLENGSLKKGLLVVVIVLLTLSVAYPPQAYAATQPATGVPYQLSVGIIPPRLPADGGTYPAVVVSLEDSGGRPSVALTNISVYLSSSSANVAKVESAMVIPQGALYATANLTTTVTPGTSTITASSGGLQTASTQVTTATPSGFPYSLRVFLAPDTVISESSYKGLLIVELLDQLGLPARAGSGALVQLTSSDARVANVSQDSLLIQPGEIYATGSFRTSFVPGTAYITASLTGLLSGGANVHVVGATALKLSISAQPASIALTQTGRVVVWLTDASGNPARATKAVTASVVSSNLTAATVSPSCTRSMPANSPLCVETITIKAGEIYGYGSFYPQSLSKGVTLSASYPNLVSSSTTVTVKQSTYVGSRPNSGSLELSIAPGPVLSDHGSYASVFVYLQNSAGLPGVANDNINVLLSSSVSSIGSVPSSVVIPSGMSWAVCNFSATYASGNTSITAASSNFLPAVAVLNTYGPVPVYISLKLLSGTLPTGGSGYQVLQVALASDSAGDPAVAATDTAIQLSSSKSQVLSVNGTVTIPAGNISTLTTLETTSLPGIANITAFATGLSPAVITVPTQIPAPSSVATYVSPENSLLSGVSPEPILVVQLQGSNGNPARAGADTLAIVTSSNATFLKTPIPVVIPKGEDYVETKLNVLTSGSATLTTVSSGLAASMVNMNVAGLALTVGVSETPASGTILSGSTATLQLTVTMEGTRMPGVKVSWNSTTGSVGPNFTVTNGNGITSTVFTSPQTNTQKVAVVRAALSSPIIGTTGAKFYVVYSPQPTNPPPTLRDKFLTLLTYVLPLVAAYIVLVVFVTIRTRRRRAREALEAGFQTLS